MLFPSRPSVITKFASLMQCGISPKHQTWQLLRVIPASQVENGMAVKNKKSLTYTTTVYESQRQSLSMMEVWEDGCGTARSYKWQVIKK